MYRRLSYRHDKEDTEQGTAAIAAQILDRGFSDVVEACLHHAFPDVAPPMDDWELHISDEVELFHEVRNSGAANEHPDILEVFKAAGPALEAMAYEDGDVYAACELAWRVNKNASVPELHKAVLELLED